MKYENIKIGDIADAYLEGEPTQRVVIVNKDEHMGWVHGINSEGRLVAIYPEFEIEKIITNIKSL